MMNIDTTVNINSMQTKQSVQNSNKEQTDGVSFSEELDNMKSAKETDENKPETKVTDEEENSNVDEALSGLEDTVEEVNKAKQENVNQTDENTDKELKTEKKTSDNQLMINNDMNIKEPSEQLLAQMGSNMNFNSDGQPFSEFVKDTDSNAKLASSQKDLDEEKAILSTLEENLAMVNRVSIESKSVKTVQNNEGIKKVYTTNNITIETVVKYDSVIVSKEDAQFFADLVNNPTGLVSPTEQTEKSSRVSKTLADLIAKAMKNNQPVRINFDNDISVIIRISRDGKISADFLPSSQVAEAYLKENLPLLKQKFDDNNIDYEELNQRNQKREQEDKDNRKKGRKDE